MCQVFISADPALYSCRARSVRLHGVATSIRLENLFWQVLEDIARTDAQGQKLLRDAAEAMRLSARGYHRVLRVARTLADLDGAETIGRLHLAEALSYRALADDLRRAA